jgi:hypothetical protein
MQTITAGGAQVRSELHTDVSNFEQIQGAASNMEIVARSFFILTISCNIGNAGSGKLHILQDDAEKAAMDR